MDNGLFQAIRTGDIDEVRRQLAAGADVDEKLCEGFDYGPFIEDVTPLMVAAAAPRSNAEIARALLEASADPSLTSEGGVTALWYAAGGGTGYRFSEEEEAEQPEHPYRFWGGGDADRLRLFLDAGLPPDESADNGRTAVGEACRIGDPERLALLIERGASVWPVKSFSPDDPEDRDWGLPEFARMMSELNAESELDPNDGERQGFESYSVPLFNAAMTGCTECVRLILSQGFPADFLCGGENALDFTRNVAVAELLWNVGVRPGPGSFGFDALDEAFENESYKLAQFFLDKALPETKGELLQQKLLMCSGVRMNPTAIQMLLDLGADATVYSSDYGSPLHYACWQGDGNGGRSDETVEETVRLLIAAGADPNLEDPDRGTPMHEAVSGDWGSPTSVRVLLELGANPDPTGPGGMTPLMEAARRGEIECVRLLLGAGADRSLRNDGGATALDMAKSHLRSWRQIVANPGEDGFDEDPEERAQRHREALGEAEAGVRLLEG